jgi:hypothetical protein
MHHSFLFIQVSSVGKVVECQDWVILREHGSNERRAVEVVAV